MSDLLSRINLPITTGRPAAPQGRTGQPKTLTEQGNTFRELLDKSLTQTRELTFSKHAQTRVEQRGVSLSPDEMNRLEQAVGMASEKGITDSLVYLGGTAFIVNIPNKVVVTVVDGSDAEHTVFTNIDGAVIV